MGLDGIILIDKDEGITSFEVVRKVKGTLKIEKAGHTGTLDKAASGLLIVCINRGTAIQDLLMGKDKVYIARMVFGVETDTLDRYGRVIKTGGVSNFSNGVIEETIKRFIGRIKQIPPCYSAIHQKGRRLYQRAIEGEKCLPEPREVEIKKLELLENEGRSITLEAVVSKGTYIRALARDIALSLGTWGYLTDLRRFSIGTFTVEKAVKLGDLTSLTPVISLNDALMDFPSIEVSNEEAKGILNGMSPERIFPHIEGDGKQRYLRVIHNNKLIAIIEKGERIKYFKVFRNFDFVYNREYQKG